MNMPINCHIRPGSSSPWNCRLNIKSLPETRWVLPQ
nr:MAG TPA: hypothetical protein [Caudoviricetes sp.]